MSMPRTLFWLPVLGILSAVVVLAACGGSGGPELPDTAAASVVDYLEEVDYQNNDDWELFPGSTKKYEGRDPHGMLLTTYVNPAAFEAIEDDATTPSGAIIVKENYMPDGNLAATTVMYKKSGYNPDHNDWYWLKVLTDGTVEKEGMVQGCQDCHVDARDYIWGPQPGS
jgi:predicted small lipoprotein YifL